MSDSTPITQREEILYSRLFRFFRLFVSLFLWTPCGIGWIVPATAQEPVVVRAESPATLPTEQIITSGSPKGIGSGNGNGTGTETADDNELRQDSLPLSKNATLWGRFAEGSWVELRSVSHAFEENQLLKNVSSIRTTLKTMADKTVTLEHRGNVEVGGKRVEGEPKLAKYDFLQQPILDNTVVRELPPVELKIADTTISCRVFQYETATPQYKQVTMVWFSADVFPHLIKTDMTRTALPPPTGSTATGSSSGQEGKVILQTQSVLLDPLSVKEENTSILSRRIRTEKKTGQSTVITTSYYSETIPGGVFKETSTELDKNNTPVRQTVTEMVKD